MVKRTRRVKDLRAALSADDVISFKGRNVLAWEDPELGTQSLPVSVECRRVGLEHALPARKGHNYQHRSHYEGFYWCAGTQKHVWYESMTEYNAVMYLDHTENLRAIAAQPACLWFADGTFHFPDYFAVHASGRQVMYDVKPRKFMDDKAKQQFTKTAEVCEEIGWDYEILHEIEGFQRHNLEWLAAYRHELNAPTAEDRQRLLEYLSTPTTLHDAALRLNFKDVSRVVPRIYHLMWTQQIDYDNQRPLNWDTRLVSKYA